MSIDYYNQNAKNFCNATLSVDMGTLYEHFEPLLNKGDSILDAGCGSGRDSLYFVIKGFNVVAFDASNELAQIASRFTGLPVQTCKFDEFYHNEMFDGIWACASLLHVPRNELPAEINGLSAFLKTNGIFYCSFKYGESDTVDQERIFTNLTEESLAGLIQNLPLEIKEIWQTYDLRPGREDESWLNAILVKK